MSDIIITTTVTVGGTTLTTNNKMFDLKRDNWNILGQFTLNELLDMGKAIDAMAKEMAKIDLTKGGL
jgi:hypothetical protein